jgi:hypothetical protein
MSREALEQALGKLVLDCEFRSAFFRDPEAATRHAGLDLTGRERNALAAIRPGAVTAFRLKLDEPRPGYSQLQPEDLPPFMRDDRTAAFRRRSLTQLSGIEAFQVQQRARRNSSRTTSYRSTPATKARTASRRVRRTGPLLRGRPSRGRTG